MKQKTNNMTPDESLAVISEMINNLKEDFKYNGFYFILWGWTISLACITHFIIIQILCRHEMFSRIGFFSIVNWVTFPLAGYIIHYAYLVKRKPRNRSLYTRFFKVLWQVAGLTLIIIAIICVKFEIYPPVFMLPIIGMATLITGLIIRYKPIIAGGIVFFIAAVISTFWLYESCLIVNAVAIILGYLVPGYMLKNTKSASHV